jgi:hypothetical protein
MEAQGNIPDRIHDYSSETGLNFIPDGTATLEKHDKP